MTPPPTSIDGTDITGATIDGQDVEEITVDGATVFQAITNPVAYSNLVAWYPFDSSFYGGANADDVTALFNAGQSGDSTAYDGTVNGATYQSSAGVTDVNAGSNSGAFDFDGTNDFIDLPSMPSSVIGSSTRTVMFWVKSTYGSRMCPVAEFSNSGDGTSWEVTLDSGNNRVFVSTSNSNRIWSANASTFDSNYHHHAIVQNGSDNASQEWYQDGSPLSVSATKNLTLNTANNWVIGKRPGINDNHFDGSIEDVRFYEKALSQNEVNTIFTNTQP